MTLAPLVTVVVAGWNAAPWAEEALASLRAQRFDRWRAVLVDDGSTDLTTAIFDGFGSMDPRFTVVHHPERRGLGAARDSGLELVDTEYVGFFDADDIMEPDALALLVGSLERTGSDIAVGAYRRLRSGPGGDVLSEIQPWVAASTAPARSGVTLAEHPSVVNNIVAWSKVSRAALWRDLRFPPGLYEDQLVTQRLYTRARRIDTVPDPVVRWRVREDGSSITQGEAHLEVLRACLAGLRAGLDVLRREAPQAALAARVRTILEMDVPRLAAHALEHPDPAYAAALDAFRREVEALAR